MARQEQDNISHVPGSAPAASLNYAPAMSPSNSRAGPSPNPNEQMKRINGTPKMGPGNIPGSPAMPGDMNRSSPVPVFDQNGAPPPHLRHQMFANGQAMMGQPPSSNPGFNMPMNQQNMEQMRMAAAAAGRLPNGQPWPNNQGPQQMMQNAGHQGAQVGTPQQRSAMPPPPAPIAEQQRTQPSSPAVQPAAPPTPSTTTKSAPKGKKEAAAKKVRLAHLLYLSCILAALANSRLNRKLLPRRALRPLLRSQRPTNHLLRLHLRRRLHLCILNLLVRTKVQMHKARTLNKLCHQPRRLLSRPTTAPFGDLGQDVRILSSCSRSSFILTNMNRPVPSASTLRRMARTS